MEQLKRLQSIEREMLSEGKSSSEIDAFKAKLRQQSYTGTTPQMGGVASLSETALNMSRGPRGIAAYMDKGGDPSVVRLGGRRKKNAPRPVNAPARDGNQSMAFTDEDIETLVDFSPFFGDIKGGADGAEFIKEELKRDDPNFLLMGIVGGAAVVGVVPILGDVAQKLIMRGARNFKKDRVTEETLSMLSEEDARIVQDLTNKTPETDLTQSEILADSIASDLRANKISRVTDERLEDLDFKGEIRLRQHYIDGNVGVDADGVPITLENSPQRMIDQGYNRVGVHGTKENNITVFNPSETGKSGPGVYLDVEATGFEKKGGLPFPTANRFAGNLNPESQARMNPEVYDQLTQNASIYPLVARTNLAPSDEMRRLSHEQIPLTFVQKLKRRLKYGYETEADAELNNIVSNAQGIGRSDPQEQRAVQELKNQSFTGVDSTDRYGEITSFDGSGLRVPTAIFDPRLTKLKNIGMAEGGEIMNGIGSLNETARGMSRGPRGIGAYQQFAGGGPVYMANGGSPQELAQQQAYSQQMSDQLAQQAAQQSGMQTARTVANLPINPGFTGFPLMPRPQTAPSNIRGDGMSANDLQRMLSRQTVAPENVADTQADIQKLQQASVARQAINDRPVPMRQPTPTASTPVGPFGGPLSNPFPFFTQEQTGPIDTFGGSMDPRTQQFEMYQALLDARDQGSSVNTTMGQPMPQSQYDYGYDSTLYKGSGGIGSLAPAQQANPQQFGLQQQNMGGLGSPQPTSNVLF